MPDGYQHDYKAFGDHVLRAEWMVAEMASRAEKVKAAAEAIAPDAPPIGEGYKQSFHVKSGIRKGKKTSRAYAEVYNDDDAAFFVEFGTKNNPRHRTLGRALGIE